MSAREIATDDPMTDNGRKNGPRLDDLAASQIGKKLRERFDEVINEPVPDRFLDLLNKLEESEKQASKESSDE